MTTPLPSGARTLGSWLADPELLRPPSVAIPHLVVEGRVTLLSGREKVGKSTLVAGAIAAASRGESVLGVSVPDPLRTVWYALDEPLGDTVRRFAGLNADLEGVLINQEPRSMSDLLAAVVGDLKKFEGVDLIVVDTLSRVFAASGCDVNDARAVEPLIGSFVDLCHTENLAALLLFHTGKGGREYRGSTAIGATVDDVLTLRRRGTSEEDDFESDADEAVEDGRRLLIQDGRNLRGRLHLSCSGGRYALLDDAHPPRERILEALSSHGSVDGRARLCTRAGVRKASGLRAIADLISDGAIVEAGKSLRLATPSAPPRFLAVAKESTVPDLGKQSEASLTLAPVRSCGFH